MRHASRRGSLPCLTAARLVCTRLPPVQTLPSSPPRIEKIRTREAIENSSPPRIDAPMASARHGLALVVAGCPAAGRDTTLLIGAPPLEPPHTSLRFCNCKSVSVCELENKEPHQPPGQQAPRPSPAPHQPRLPHSRLPLGTLGPRLWPRPRGGLPGSWRRCGPRMSVYQRRCGHREHECPCTTSWRRCGHRISVH